MASTPNDPFDPSGDGPTQFIPNRGFTPPAQNPPPVHSYPPSYPPAAPPAQSYPPPQQPYQPPYQQQAGAQWGPPAPPYPPGPQFGGHPVPPGKGTKTPIIIGSVVVAALVAAGVGIAVFAGGSDDEEGSSTMTQAGAPTTGETVAPETEEEVAAPDPESVLLTPDEMEDAVGGSITVRSEGSTLTDNSDSLDRTECMSPWGPLERRSYAGTGYDEIAGQSLKDRDDPSLAIVQGAVSFPSSQAAKDYLAEAEKSWQECANSAVVATSTEGKVSTWRFDSLRTLTGGLMTMSQSPEDSTSWGCERALGRSGALIVDTMVCGHRSSGDGRAVAQAILENAEGEGS